MISRLGPSLFVLLVSFHAFAQSDAGVLVGSSLAPAAEEKPVAEAEPVQEPWYTRVTPFGYAKLGVFYTLPLRDENQLIGGSGGFRLAQLRLGAEWNIVPRMRVVASLEAAAPSRADDGVSGKRIVELRDAYAQYRICRGFTLRGGQFKAPFWRETLLEDATLPFISRSVVSEGLALPEAYGPRAGLSLDRQVGLQAASDWLMEEKAAFNFRYALAVVNGNGLNGLFNDNNIVTPVARAELQFFSHASLGLNGYYNVAAAGTRPNRVSASHFGYGADLSVQAFGFTLMGGFVGKRSFYDGNLLTPDTAYGAMVSLYGAPQCNCRDGKPLLGGFELGVRYAIFEPSMAQSDDQTSDFAVMVGYKLEKVPLRILAQYTLRFEAPAATLNNDSLDLLAQLQW